MWSPWSPVSPLALRPCARTCEVAELRDEHGGAGQTAAGAPPSLGLTDQHRLLQVSDFLVVLLVGRRVWSLCTVTASSHVSGQTCRPPESGAGPGAVSSQARPCSRTADPCVQEDSPPAPLSHSRAVTGRSSTRGPSAEGPFLPHPPTPMSVLGGFASSIRRASGLPKYEHLLVSLGPSSTDQKAPARSSLLPRDKVLVTWLVS